MSDAIHRTAHTQVRVAPTRIPPGIRPRLAQLAARGCEVFRRHSAAMRSIDREARARRADLLGEMCSSLELALLDVASSELRAENAESRARRAEQDLAIARKTIIALQADIARAAEFTDQPTAAREAPALVARSRR